MVAIVYEQPGLGCCRRAVRFFYMDGRRTTCVAIPLNLAQTYGRFIKLIACIDPYEEYDNRWHYITKQTPASKLYQFSPNGVNNFTDVESGGGVNGIPNMERNGRESGVQPGGECSVSNNSGDNSEYRREGVVLHNST